MPPQVIRRETRGGGGAYISAAAQPQDTMSVCSCTCYPAR